MFGELYAVSLQIKSAEISIELSLLDAYQQIDPDILEIVNASKQVDLSFIDILLYFCHLFH